MIALGSSGHRSSLSRMPSPSRSPTGSRADSGRGAGPVDVGAQVFVVKHAVAVAVADGAAEPIRIGVRALVDIGTRSSSSRMPS